MEKVKRIWYLVNLIYNYIVLSIQNYFKKLPPNKKTILFTFDDENLFRDNDGDGRYAYLTLKRFSDAGYNVYFYRNVSLLGFAALRKYGRFIYSIKNLKFISKLPTNTREIIYAFDDIHGNLLNHHWKKLTYVNIIKPTFCQIGQMINIPYYFHPFMYKLDQHLRLEELRSSQRKMRIFFGGKNIEQFYKRKFFLDIYKQLTRTEALEALGNFKEQAKFVRNIDEFNRLISQSDYSNKCYVVESNNVSIAHTQWFDTIAKSDFFLCLSGVELPMCHNSIEAMSLGTIPIISYYDWFFPPLEHGKNAIIYTNKEDFVAKVKEVFEMDQNKIDIMRTNVINYYEKYLSAKSFMDRYESLGKVNTIMLHPRLITKDKANIHGKALITKLRQKMGISYPTEIKEVEEPFASMKFS
jgi:hypothetical protein